MFGDRVFELVEQPAVDDPAVFALQEITLKLVRRAGQYKPDGSDAEQHHADANVLDLVAFDELDHKPQW